MYPARVAGGDYYDYTVSPDGNLRLVIADVSGKGVAAALLMAATAAAVCVETDEPRRFRTVLFGELDSRSRRLKYINCGHSPALLFRPETSAVQWLHASCTPIGLSRELNCRLEEIPLAPSDMLVWYTDGVTEASDREDNEFGSERILEVVRKHSKRTAREICDRLYQAVAGFTQRNSLDDDLTIMVVKMEDDPDSSPAFSD